MALQSLDHGKLPCTPAFRELAGGGSVSVLRSKDLSEMGLGGLLMVLAPVADEEGD